MDKLDRLVLLREATASAETAQERVRAAWRAEAVGRDEAALATALEALEHVYATQDRLRTLVCSGYG